MKKFKWIDLQLFAGEGSSGGEGGGEGSATGVEAVDPGQQRLLELGVPANRISKRASEAVAKKMSSAPKNSEQGQAQEPTEQVASADNAPTEGTPGRMTWDDIMKDPEYNKEMQNTIRARLRSAKTAEDNMAKLAPALEVLARKHGLDMKNLDYSALAEKINNDEIYYEDKALEMGVSVDQARQLDQKERDAARQQMHESMARDEEMFRAHIENLKQQAEAMKEQFPKFNLQDEMKDPRFVRMTSPSGGLSVEDAYYAIHRKEIQMAAMQATHQATARQIANAIQSGSRRPKENGSSSAAPSSTTFDLRNATPEQRANFVKFAKAERAKGNKVHPRDFTGW